MLKLEYGECKIQPANAFQAQIFVMAFWFIAHLVDTSEKRPKRRGGVRWRYAEKSSKELGRTFVLQLTFLGSSGLCHQAVSTPDDVCRKGQK